MKPKLKITTYAKNAICRVKGHSWMRRLGWMICERCGARRWPAEKDK